MVGRYDVSPDELAAMLDGEPRYETIPVGFYMNHYSRLDRFDDFDVRQAAYWAVLAGACGHTYGNNSVWQMWQPGRKPVLWASIPWRDALDHPGAFQMGHLRRLFESRSFAKLVPDHTLVLNAPQSGGAKVRAARAPDGTSCGRVSQAAADANRPGRSVGTALVRRADVQHEQPIGAPCF